MDKTFIFLLGMMLFFQSILMFYLSMYFVVYKVSYFLQWEVMSINSFSVEMVIIVDWITLIFLSVVFIISSMVMFYSMGYMAGDCNSSRFFKLLFMFILSMVFLIISPNMMSILIGWDGLGLISYCLVIYYSNYVSYNFGMITFLCNRVGDVGILMLIALLMVNGSWNLIFYNESTNMIIFFLILSSMTKSAQIPFSSWLPKAMAAPTPVSSLVHSSTLVTAGVYLMIRYNYMVFNSLVSYVLFIMSSLTMLMSGMAANVENDLKKIIALSTLSQLGLMMSILSLGQPMLAFFHLLTHAMFKSLLFLSSGCIIHSFNNNQDIRLMGSMIKFLPFVVFVFFCASLSLMGFPFLSGFYSKDLIMEFMLMNKSNIVCMMMLFFGTIMTVSYSIRLMLFMILGQGNFMSVSNVYEGGSMLFSMFVLLGLSMCGGSLLNGLFFDSEDVIVLDIFMKLLIFVMFFMGVFLGYIFYYMGLSKVSFFVSFFGMMWYVDKFMKLMADFFYTFGGLMNNLEKVWIEYCNVFMIDKFLFMFYLIKTDLNLFSFIQFFVLLFIFLFCLV